MRATDERAGGQSGDAASAAGPEAGDAPAGTGWTVVAAALPAAAAGTFYFGLPALGVLAGATGGCLVCETLARRALGRTGAQSRDRAVLVGLLLGMILPPAAPAWLILTGCAAAMLAPRLLRLGLGFNPLHPALIAAVSLLVAFPEATTSWSPPIGLFASAPAGVTAVRDLDLLDGLVGRVAGGAGDTSAVALALGGLFLLWRGVVGWRVPAGFLAGVAAPSALFAALAPERFAGAGSHLVSGGLALGALFIATDPLTAAESRRGMAIYGAGCGLVTWLLRSFGDCGDGAVWFAIFLMSLCVPLINLYGGNRRDDTADAGLESPEVN
jgi:electron transport complex protein RnfD